MHLLKIDKILKSQVSQQWHNILGFNDLIWQELLLELSYTYINANAIIYPALNNIFAAFNNILPNDIKVIILGQDPYHGFAFINKRAIPQAHGLAFSVPIELKIPPSLKNIYKELLNSGCIDKLPEHGNLQKWQQQGVLLLNNSLTVEQGRANSHTHVWQKWSELCIKNIAKLGNKVWLLWGANAQQHIKNVQNFGKNNLILTAAHPSPLAAYRGFLGCGHFIKVNQFLQENNLTQIDWRL